MGADVMDDCWSCGTRITTLGDSWVHLAEDNDGHEPAPKQPETATIAGRIRDQLARGEATTRDLCARLGIGAATDPAVPVVMSALNRMVSDGEVLVTGDGHRAAMTWWLA
jgi:hypothetical protein